MSGLSKRLHVKKNESGFTLIELVAVIIILGLIMGIAYGVILLNARTFKFLSDNIVSRWDVRKTMDVIRKDVQELNAKNIIGPTLTPHNGSKLYFKTLDGQKIMYHYNNKMLLRKVVGAGHHIGWGVGTLGGWDILLKNVLKPPFQFLDRDMNLTNDVNKLSYIKVRFVVDSGGKMPIIMENLFYLRNTAPLAP